ncbi:MULTISPECIES: c-type cytochrome [Rhizobium]|uniref:Cytochrome c n=1 Tax=Rhizobium bangladeshense TaxID=1138189 RepID=A0ABS7LM24_9HYPH|nr:MULTISPECIES: cytochrome c [Rhizobium]MBX4869446.1 cytochrome c [Rhizobium bangladeshense]MBX4874841.1 cytochrome c [Rhizobium bangladeshense]MBX4885118.1 cytochrome c [Rhizobium bangladeshense]MBX4891931.1 cytochrome c [Rhizobium bangladeshense]MBX4897200.1 cytochrome c [Rhizobium bangladeshense]
MNWKAVAAAAAMAGLAVGSVTAADGTQDSRVAQMKQMGGSTGALSAIAKGSKPYDAEAVKAALTTIATTAKAFPDQFKPGSDMNDPGASPKIWENMEDFKARSEKLSADAETALAQLPADAAAVGAAVNTLGANCAGCHKAYRLSK